MSASLTYVSRAHIASCERQAEPNTRKKECAWQPSANLRWDRNTGETRARDLIGGV